MSITPPRIASTRPFCLNPLHWLYVGSGMGAHLIHEKWGHYEGTTTRPSYA